MPSGGWGRGEPCASVSFMGTIHDDGPGPRFGASVRVYATVTLVHPTKRPQRTGF
jgi:hypothetical protein